jgi:hypothetical protein
MTSRLGIFYVHNGAVKQQPIKCTIRNSNKRESPYLIIIEKYLYSLKSLSDGTCECHINNHWATTAIYTFCIYVIL